MRRPAAWLLGALWVLGLLGGRPGAPARAEEPGVSFRRSLAEARAEALARGRPIFYALHTRGAGSAPWPADAEGWIALYRDGSVRAAAAGLIPVLRVLDPRPGEAAGPPHLMVLAPDGRVLVEERAWPFARGAESARALSAFLAKGLRTFEAHGAAAPPPRPGAAPAAPGPARRPGGALHDAVPIALASEGLSVRLRWEFPAPALPAGGAAQLEGTLAFTFDGLGPFPLDEVLRARPGEALDLWVEIRFAEHPALAPLLTAGEHHLEVWLAPTPDSYPFAQAPLRVARAWIQLGDGGGGGGGGGAGAEGAPPPDAPPAPPEELAPEGPTEAPPPPEAAGARTEVVEPFVREGEEVRKEEALVAVPHPDAGTKPPRRVPVAEALGDLERHLERAVREERVPPADRAFLERYFEALRRAAGAGR